jgi:dATP pyrophosphohydrolase
LDIVTVSKAIVFNHDDKVLLLKRSATDIRRPGQWDVPGGHVDDGEYLAETAARETHEEAGLTIDSQEIPLVYAMTEMADESHSVTWVFFMARTGLTDVKLSHEHDEYVWVTLEEALGMIEYERQRRALKYVADNNLVANLKD